MMISYASRCLLMLACCAMFAAGCKKSESVLLTASSVSAFSCQFPYGTNCFWGESQLPGCTSSCRYANVPEARIRFAIRITGTLIQPNDAGPLASFPVYVLLPNNKKYLTRTDNAGFFSIEYKPEVREENGDTDIFDYNFGELVTVQEAPAFAIVLEPTKDFQERYPAVVVREVDVANFDGETITLQ